ncbi:unnamed protein product [Clonostachys rosea]|uniref:Uncharacterized protein n=1 Tax=Bionectria ochroleuca TaxID=29856 RepID=A0ABY6TNI2_BIOOC|nr:unnamed protein product [Clonostachys rosea]
MDQQVRVGGEHNTSMCGKVMGTKGIRLAWHETYKVPVPGTLVKCIDYGGDKEARWYELFVGAWQFGCEEIEIVLGCAE